MGIWKNLFEGAFGFEFNKGEEEKFTRQNPSFVDPVADGSVVIGNSSGGADHFISPYLLDPSTTGEYDLINNYRKMALYPECDTAIEEIINEMIVNDEQNQAIQINLDQVELPKNVKSIISEEFDEVLSLLDFNTKGYSISKKWYIDSRVAYHKVINTSKTTSGIQELRPIDPRRLIRVKEVEDVVGPDGVTIVVTKEEYFLYFNTPINASDDNFGVNSFSTLRSSEARTYKQQALKIGIDSIAFAHSGLVDQSTNIIYGYLQKAIKPFNQLRILEDAVIIYRLTRAPERRAFYVDVGNMAPAKAQEYLQNIQSKFRNNLEYDSITGKVKDVKRVLAMQEDFWLPRFGGGRGTEISTLDGGANLGEINDLIYFRNALWNSLNVPPSRFKEDSASIILGQNTEISREELKFAKFITRLRTQFNDLFQDILRTQLILKKIINEKDWEEIKERIQYEYLQDSYYSEAKESELLRQRIELLETVSEHIGTYYSNEYVRKKILRQTDDEIETIDKEIEDEKSKADSNDEAYGAEEEKEEKPVPVIVKQEKDQEDEAA